MLAALDGQRTLAQACASAQISADRGVAVIRKLTSLGMVARGSGPALRHLSLAPADPAPAAPTTSSVVIDAAAALAAPAETPFSPAEEAFFATELRPIDECDLPFPSMGERVGRVVNGLLGRCASHLGIF